MSFVQPNIAIQPLIRNEILKGLSREDYAPMRTHLTRVRLVQGQILHEAGERIEHAYFLEEGIVSMVAQVDDQGAPTGIGMTEIGMTGREGMVGLPVLLQADALSFSRSLVQLPGVALRIPAPALRDLVVRAPELRRRLYRALHILMSTISQTAACNSRHTLPERLARWLLIAHDRVEGDDLPLTQEFLSIMLGVRRSGVTVASAALERNGLLRHNRGRVTITDRDGLERASCNCYAQVRAFIHSLPQCESTVGNIDTYVPRSVA